MVDMDMVPDWFSGIIYELSWYTKFSPEFSADTYYTSFSQEFSPELSRIISNFHQRCTVIIAPKFAPVPMKICEN